MADDDLDRDSFEVEIEGVDDRFRGIFQQYHLTTNYMTPTDAWSFVVYSEKDQYDLRRIWRPLQPVRLHINGACQVIGRIDGIEGVPETGGALRVFGRDYLADIVDATVDPLFDVKQGQTLESVLQDLLRPFGITKIESSNIDALAVLLGNAGATKISKGKKRRARDISLADFKAEENQGVFEFANKILARHGLLLLPAPERDTVIVDEPNYDQDPIFRLDRPGNILEASARRDYSGVPTVTVARGRGSFANDSATSSRQQYPTFTGSNAPGRKVARTAEVERILERYDSVSSVIEDRYDPKFGGVPLPGTLYRPLFYRDQNSRNQQQLDSAVKRMIAEKLRETLTLSVTMRGHVESRSGAVYAVDTIAEVSDTIEDINENLWCFERTFENDGNGPKTKLEYIRPDCYVLSEPVGVAQLPPRQPKPAPPAQDPAAARRAAAAEAFVAQNFGTPAGPTDLLEGLRGR